jgi:Xaa-Pro aminopeptidase
LKKTDSVFSTSLYIERRKALRSKVSSGVILIAGNNEAPYNYRGNTYPFRQDSTFSYFFGLNTPGLAGIIDVEEDTEILFGDDIDIEDIIWMGNLPDIKERATHSGITKTLPVKEIIRVIKRAQSLKRKIHFLPPYRGENINQLEYLLGIPKTALQKAVSAELIKAVIDLRSVKDKFEIAEIENMVDIAYQMHTCVMKMAKPGILEKEIAGKIEGIAISLSKGCSFPIILTMNGQTLHSHLQGDTLQKGKLLLTDAGAESELLYASDITRTVPVGGKFSPIQKDIYSVVLAANLRAIELVNPETTYRDVHLAAAKVIASGLKELGLMKGNVDDAVEAGAHALFFPHGLGHALGMDVHDLEGLGEDNVGYDSTVRRSKQFGLEYLRFAKNPKPGSVLTVEPGIYFIPELIDLWRSGKKFTDYIDYVTVETYKGFGGIRIEDDIVVTSNGCRLLGKPIPKMIEEIETMMK